MNKQNTETTIEQQIEKIVAETSRRRLDQNNGYIKRMENGWRYVRCFRYEDVRREARKWLMVGHKVSGGYFSTSVRGYHEKTIMHKEIKKR